jgi:two-component system, chemotaxis family, sensor kinase CheA
VVDASADDGVELARALHTLKGNAAMLGLGGLARLCDQLEGRMAEAGGELDRTGRQQLAGRWQDEERRFAAVLDAGQSRRLEVDGDEYEALLGAARGGLQAAELLRWLESWRQEPVERRLGQLGEQAERLAARLGKSPLRVTIDAGDLRLPPRALSEFWSACVHVVRNAVDHGIESADERRAAGKPAVAEIALAARLEEGGEGARFELEVRDSGRGIDWGLVKQGAARAGHAASTEAQLREALFADGVTTRDAATELSGRGVGLGAARAACERTGGVMAIYSERGVGTRVCFRWPAAALGVARGHGEPARGPVAPAPEAAVSGQSSATTAA